MNVKEAEILIEKYTEGNATPEERKLVEYYFHQHLANSDASPDLAQLQKDNKEVWNNLVGYIGETKSSKYKFWPRVGIAAAVAVVVFGAGLFYFGGDNRVEPVKTVAVVNDIAPGKNGATITLANGKVIQLSDAKKGVVVGEELKYDDGTEILRSALNDKEAKSLTASTTKGQTYEFTLPDGTHVWLNADSRISFSSQFIGKTRKILLDGEAYFEVVKNRKIPFIVESNGQEVEVLGTHFNINSYADEGSIKTTLLEGSVKVAALSPPSQGGMSNGRGVKAKEGTILKPGQQSVVSGSNRIAVKEVDPLLAMGWKDGKFRCKNESLESLMRKVARWYNVEVVYVDAGTREQTFTGILSRFDHVSKLLKRIEMTGLVRFKIEGKKIMVVKGE